VQLLLLLALALDPLRHLPQRLHLHLHQAPPSRLSAPAPQLRPPQQPRPQQVHPPSPPPLPLLAPSSPQQSLPPHSPLQPQAQGLRQQLAAKLGRQRPRLAVA